MLPPMPDTPEPLDSTTVRATGHAYPVRAFPTPRPEAVMVDIIDRYNKPPEGEAREGAQGIHVGTDVIINGQRTYTPADSKVSVETCGLDATRVTITFFARRVRIGHEDELLDA